MTYFADVAALVRKDLLVELRARESLPAMALFVIAVIASRSLRGVPWQKRVRPSPSTSSVAVSGQASASACSSGVSCASSHSYLARHRSS